MKIYLLKNIKMLHDEFCMTKLEFLLDHICYLGQESFDIYAACFALSFVKLCDPYERFVMLLKSRSCTHDPHMHYSYTGGRCKNMPSIQIHPKCFTPTLRVNTKNTLDRFFHPPNKCSKVLVAISQKFCCRKETWVMQKLFIKKEERKKKY